MVFTERNGALKKQPLTSLEEIYPPQVILDLSNQRTRRCSEQSLIISGEFILLKLYFTPELGVPTANPR